MVSHASEREEKVIKYWKENKIDDKARKKNTGKKPMYFLDGPPYVTGDLHPGHIWVKSLKDLFVRYKRFRGYDVVDRAGYDVHGLPTENAVERRLKINHKKEIEEKIGIANFNKECRDFIDYYINRMNNDYERFGVSLDFSKPYLPHSNEYIETAWSMLKKADQNGYLYSGYKTTAYCPRCECVVSQGTMEVEHGDEEDPSIYILFKVDKQRSKPKLTIPDESYLLVWTTTPWTLPANVAIAVNPNELYVSALVGGKNMIFAKQRMDQIAALLDESIVVKEEFYGKELEGTYYVNALESKVEKQKELRKYHRVISAPELVSVSEGTGLVHMAPGHGLEDYSVGMKAKLPIFSPVAPDATYNEDAGAYKGLKVPGEANKVVLEDLNALGVLMNSGKLTHSYPHCWRCHTKLIFIASPQWFLNVQKIKRRLLKANEKITWHPEEARAWERDIMTNSPDWCISRQRYWAFPMPIWICDACKNRDVIGSRKELEERAINREHVANLKDLHRPHIDKINIKCSKCGGESKRVIDVMDVWWDSSIAFRASLTEEQFGKLFPVEFVVEYIEQIRAWFQYTIKTGMFVYGKNPFKHIVVHGIMWGTDGRKMSKSFGNYKPLSEMTTIASADAFRLWALNHDPILNRNLNETEIRDSEKTVLLLQNISNLLKEYIDLTGYRPKLRKRLPEGMDNEEAWIYSRYESIVKIATEAFDKYDAYTAISSLRDFVTEDFSRLYLKLAKKRMLNGDKKQAKRIIDVINHILFNTLIMFSPVMPFVTESVYLDMYKFNESIFLEQWPKQNGNAINKTLEQEMDIAKETMTAILNSREKGNIPLRWPTAKALLDITDDGAFNAIQKLSPIIESLVNAKRIELKRVSGVKEEVKPIFAKIGPDFKEKANAVATALKGADPDTIRKSIDSTGYYELHTDLGPVQISPQHYSIVQGVVGGDAILFKYGKAEVDTEMNEGLMEEATVREFARRVQMMRKELKLKKPDKIALHYEALGKLSEILKRNLKQLSTELNTKSIDVGKGEGHTKTFEVEGDSVLVTIRKV